MCTGSTVTPSRCMRWYSLRIHTHSSHQASRLKSEPVNDLCNFHALPLHALVQPAHLTHIARAPGTLHRTRICSNVCNMSIIII